LLEVFLVVDVGAMQPVEESDGAIVISEGGVVEVMNLGVASRVEGEVVSPVAVEGGGQCQKQPEPKQCHMHSLC